MLLVQVTNSKTKEKLINLVPIKYNGNQFEGFKNNGFLIHNYVTLLHSIYLM